MKINQKNVTERCSGLAICNFVYTYASPISEIILDLLQLNGYADDHSLRKSFKPSIIHEPTNNTNIDDETCTIAITEDTTLKVKTWMDAVCLKLNE